jgi:chromate transporter
MCITAGLGWAYVTYGSLPAVGFVLYGVKPVILGVVVQAIWSLAAKAITSLRLRVLAVLAVALGAFGVNELLLLATTGVASVVAARAAGGKPTPTSLGAFAPLAPALATATITSTFNLPSLFWVFFKTGSVLFGSGYVLLAFLRADLVERLGWLTEAQLLDAIAVGQITPGPVFTTATFIGYVLGGPAGALVATAGIFLPAFVFVALSGPLVPRLRRSQTAAAFLDGVNAASLALMAVVTLQLGRAALVDVTTIALALISAAVLVRFRVNSSWLVLAGAAAGCAVHALDLAR